MLRASSRCAVRTLCGCLFSAVLISAAPGYIKRSVFRDTRDQFRTGLKHLGWGTSLGAAEYPPNVNRLVGSVLRFLPAPEAEIVSLKARREIARRTQEAIEEAEKTGKNVRKTGQIDNVRYCVGVYAFETYWEMDEGKHVRIHGHQRGLAPFVSFTVGVPGAEQEKE